MKVTILYHPASDHSRVVEEFAGNYKRNTGKEVELLSLETKAGAELARLYGVQAYPGILMLRDDGQLYKLLEGLPLPLINDIQTP